jgi:hypothetical protein
MQQRQLRLGDILDDYCPRERRITNHAVVAMVGSEVRQTRCTTCDSEHAYKHAKVPRQRRKSETAAVLQAEVLANAPKWVAQESVPETPATGPAAPIVTPPTLPTAESSAAASEPAEPVRDQDEGPAHRPLIRATLPRPEGQPSYTRPAPEFTVRQNAGRAGRFRSRQHRGITVFRGDRSSSGSGGLRSDGRLPTSRSGRHRKRQK